jgi:hypothetical protein
MCQNRLCRTEILQKTIVCWLQINRYRRSRIQNDLNPCHPQAWQIQLKPDLAATPGSADGIDAGLHSE